jgi:hypothetical protein
MARNGPIPDATIAVIANPWQGPSNRTRNHGAVRSRASCLVINRGCDALIRLAITPAAYAVVAATHPASAHLERSGAPNGEFYVWLEPQYVDRLRAVRKPGESYSDVILRLAEASEGGE